MSAFASSAVVLPRQRPSSSLSPRRPRWSCTSPGNSSRSNSAKPSRKPSPATSASASRPPPPSPPPASQPPLQSAAVPKDAWRASLVPGAVVEIWSGGSLAFGTVVEICDRSIVVSLIDCPSSNSKSVRDAVKVAFGEVICVWPRHLCPSLGTDPANSCTDPAEAAKLLLSDVDAGLRLIKTSRPRSLNLLKLYDALRRVPKSDARSRRTSFQLAARVFPLFMRGPRERRAAATVATSVLIAADAVRFKRAEEGAGWRALPPSVAVARSRSSFVETCKKLLEPATPVRERASPWSRDHLEILREIEICAASGSAAGGAAATALGELGFEATDDGAAALLLSIGYWATGTVERDGGGTTQASAVPALSDVGGSAPLGVPGFGDGDAKKRARLLDNVSGKRIGSAEGSSDRTGSGGSVQQGGARDRASVDSSRTLGKSSCRSAQAGSDAGDGTAKAGADSAEELSADEGEGSLSPGARQTLRDWTFPPPILAEARELRLQARERRRRFVDGEATVRPPRKSLVRGTDGRPPPRVYCVDDKNARFLDDAVSIEILQPGKLVRICVHVADVDETVRSGSAIDELAKERGQSLYLPLKPLHMLPAAAMDAASFSTSSPTEGITAVMDMDVTSGELIYWEIFASLVPPVTRINYDQLDAALDGRQAETGLSQEILRDMQGVAALAPLLADKLDTRRNGRKLRRGGSARLGGESLSDSGSVSSSSPSSDDEVGIAAVRLVRRREYGPNAGRGKVAKVVDFRSTGGHAVIADILLSVSTLFRQFAHRHGAFLPEDRGAYQYVSRCGTAPMRRYADLAVQRQIKCLLFGREPAGRRRMDELRAWLAKRHAAGEKTLAVRRKAALYDSLADHCQQQRQAAKQPYATLRGKVRNVTVTRRRAVRVEVGIDGTGLFTMADVDQKVVATEGALWERDPGLRDEQLRSVRKTLNTGDRVSVQVSHVDTVAQRIVATVVGKLSK